MNLFLKFDWYRTENYLFVIHDKDYLMESLMERFGNLLEYAPSDEVDLYSKKQLKSRLYQWKNRDKEYLSKIDYFVNGKEYTSLLDSISCVDDLEKIKLKFLKPNLEGGWNFSKPTKAIMEKNGKGICKTFNYDPYSLDKWANADKINTEKVMVRAFITDYFCPISIDTKSKYHHAEDIPRQYEPHLKKLKEIWSDFRSGVLPFEIRLCVYTKRERYAYLVDTVSDVQRPHPLNKISIPDTTDRRSIDYMHLDRVLANIDLSPILKNIMELLFNVDELTIHDIAHYFNLRNKIAENSLNSLIAKGFVEVRKNTNYQISIEKIRDTAKALN